MSRVFLQYLAAAAATLVSIGVLRGLRGFYWPHAMLVGFAIGGLVFTTWRTIDRMRQGR